MRESERGPAMVMTRLDPLAPSPLAYSRAHCAEPRRAPAPNILSLVLAGGEGHRLLPLTAEHAKPALPIAGRYRLIDFVLSNLCNSGLRRIKVLTQYKSDSLTTHLA